MHFIFYKTEHTVKWWYSYKDFIKLITFWKKNLMMNWERERLASLLQTHTVYATCNTLWTRPMVFAENPQMLRGSDLRRKRQSRRGRTGTCWAQRLPGYGLSADAAPHAPSAHLSVYKKRKGQNTARLTKSHHTLAADINTAKNVTTKCTFVLMIHILV